MKTIRIDRSKWGTGYLWDFNKKEGCCLGHCFRQLAHCSWENLDSNTMPEDVLGQYIPKVLRTDEALGEPWTYKAATINDDPLRKYTSKEKEKKLKKLFKKNKLKLEFFGKYKKDSLHTYKDKKKDIES